MWDSRLTGYLLADLSAAELGQFVGELADADAAGDPRASAVLPVAVALRELALARRAGLDDAAALALVTRELADLSAALRAEIVRHIGALAEWESTALTPGPSAEVPVVPAPPAPADGLAPPAALTRRRRRPTR